MAKVLVVEDDRLNRNLVARFVTLQGHTVITASDGAEGVAKALAECPDLILMDIAMPVMDGWQAVEALRAAPETRSVPVIALTAYATKQDRERCLEVGFNDYISKPVDFPQLVVKMQALLESEDKPGTE